jgi:alkanesulfonate monooxygenase SsuD/methylene tetrahydromethanopterin reductase-like flavin-dependent oxidoreductase (luciferase family)
MFGSSPAEVEPGVLIGSADELRDRIRRFVEAGVTHFILICPPQTSKDTIRRFAEEVIPEFRI